LQRSYLNGVSLPRSSSVCGSSELLTYMGKMEKTSKTIPPLSDHNPI
jgi:hypothetical protein